MTADVQRELAEALEDKLVETVGSQMPPGHVWNLDKVTDALLPLIADAEKRAAAGALREAADDWDANTNHVCDAPQDLRDRAAALDPQ